MAPSIGDPVPAGIALEASPDAATTLDAVCAPGKTVVLFAVPGAFTPTCSATHLPGFVASADAFKAAGADEIVCITPNDVFVAAAWAQSAGADGKVTVLADKDNALAKAWDVVLDAEGKLGTKRIKRLSAVIRDGKVAALNVEPDGGGATCSLAEPTLEQLKGMK